MKREFFKGALLMISTTFLMACLMSCSGGGGSKSTDNNNNTPTSYAISGLASMGLISGGTVNIYAITNDGQKGSSLGSTITGSDGTYSFTLTDYTGPVLVEVTGGTYIDEATGATLTLGVTLRAALPSVSGNVNIAVTPLTEIAVLMAEAGGGFDTVKIQNANDLLSQLIGADIVSTLPADGNDSAKFGSASADAKNYALLLAAVSKYSETTGQDAADVIKVLKSDISDLNLDSKDDLLAAIAAFLSSDKNKTGVNDASALAAIITNIGSNGFQPTGTLADMKKYFIAFIKDSSETNYTSLMNYMDTFTPASNEAHLFKAMADLMDIYRNSAVKFLKDNGLVLGTQNFDEAAFRESLLKLSTLDTDISGVLADIETRLDTVNSDISQAAGAKTMISLTGFDTVYLDDVDVKILKLFTHEMQSVCILTQAVNLHVDNWVLDDTTDVRNLIKNDVMITTAQVNEFLTKNPDFLKWKAGTTKLGSFKTAMGKVSEDLQAVVTALDAIGSAGRAKRVENAFNIDSDLMFYMTKAGNEKAMPSIISAMDNADTTLVQPSSQEVSGSIVKKDDGYSYHRNLNDIYLKKFIHNTADTSGITAYSMLNGTKTFRDLTFRRLAEPAQDLYIENIAGKETYMTGVEDIEWDNPIKSFTVPAASITIDGNASDWANVPVLCSSGGATVKLAAGAGNVYYAYVSFLNGFTATDTFSGGIGTHWPWAMTPTTGYYSGNADFYVGSPSTPPGVPPANSLLSAEENGFGGPGGGTYLPVSEIDKALIGTMENYTGFEIKFSHLDWIIADNYVNNLYFEWSYLVSGPGGTPINNNGWFDKEIKLYR